MLLKNCAKNYRSRKKQPVPRKKTYSRIIVKTLFENINLYSVDDNIIREAARFRQVKKLSLGDSIIAATASIHMLTLVTANTKDFKKFPELDLINPLEV